MLGFEQGCLNLSFHTDGFKVRVMECPGLWMSPAQQDELVAALRQVALATLDGKDLGYGVFHDRESLRSVLITLVRDAKDGQAAAFNAMPLLPVPLHGQEVTLQHVGLAMVHPGYQQRGLTWLLYGLTSVLLLLKNRLQPFWVSNVTQVPSVFGKACEGYQGVFPSPRPGARPSFDQCYLARGLLARHRHRFGVGPEAGFDEARFVITNSYTGGSENLKKTFEQAPKHRDPAINAYCQTHLDYARGDDFLQIGRFDLAGARDFLLRDVPRRSLFRLSLALAYSVLAGFGVPILLWFDTRHALGVLRPRD
jgi:hypothetical protein